jgi:adenine-specific DNA-methyltransferase
MGSKAAILPFISQGLSAVSIPEKPIVDLFGGACSISGAFGNSEKIITNDIQEYSSVIASCYLRKCNSINTGMVLEQAKVIAENIISSQDSALKYPQSCSLDEFNSIEKLNQELINCHFDDEYHLFSRFYSGTWWSFEQCAWIDGIRGTLDKLLDSDQITLADFNLGLSCLMHAMAYASQGTGHYAQYRDAKTVSSMNDINKYRQKSIPELFSKKMAELLQWNKNNVVDHNHQILTLDYQKCLEAIPQSTIYADPPYAFVHYSRFYHAIETVVKYDYPELQEKAGKIVKGRYRVDRHQSPFCIKTTVKKSFLKLFDGVRDSHSNLVLSYSNTGMIDITDLLELAHSELGNSYKVWAIDTDHDHMTMGRKDDHLRQVKESMILCKRAL